MELPKKEPLEARTENPTIRCTPTNKARIVRAATFCGYKHFTEWMHDAVMTAVTRAEEEEAQAAAATKKKATKKRRRSA
jgi:hypothetical protein